MHLYRLASFKTLALILYQVSIFIQGSQQSSQHKRQAGDLSKATTQNYPQETTGGNGTKNHDTFASPFIVLMSSDAVSVAQLPMMLYGNLTDVYVLADDEKALREIDLEEQHQNDNDEQDAKSLEDETEDPKGGRKRTSHHEGELIADAREYEQMPHMMGVNTTTSLGKSEWQQIAVGGHDRGEAQALPTQTNRKNAQDGENEEGEGKHLSLARRRRRRRRSNSLSDYDDDSGNNTSGNSNVSEPKAKGTENNTSDAQTSRRAEESNMQNVTSAQSNFEQQQQQQPNLPSKEKSLAEDSDKISRSSSYPPSLSPSSPPPPPATSSTASSAASSSNRVHFTDFDVHMSLGYAFVADSAGRIHRFRLPTSGGGGSHTRSPSLQPNDITGIIVSSSNNGEKAVGENDDAANRIDAGSKFEYASRQSKVVESRSNGGSQWNGPTERTSNGFRSHANHGGEADAYGGGYSNNRIRENGDDANNVSSSGKDDTHELSANERQHPTISGEQNVFIMSSPASGAPQVVSDNHEQTLDFRGGKRPEQVDGVKPRIIWSRSKYARGPLADAGAVIGASSAKQREHHHHQQQQQLANVKEALPANSAEGSHQETAADESTSGRHSDVTPQHSEQQPSIGKKSTSSEKHGRQHPSLSSTKVAVDWLNNLLFVLDKCRLLVMDFEGNNELVLIDDFNANNRPIGIKVDPINDFLFWLQIGKFHNIIYKLDLSVLSMPSATQKLVSNALRLRQSVQTNTSDNGSSFDAIDLVPLVSHHYAHPIITNLPRHTRIFTIDHKHSRIYVPLGSQPSPTESDNRSKEAASSPTNTEVFAPSDDIAQFRNSQTESLHTTNEDTNCTGAGAGGETLSTEGQILAYNLDGTDVGPLRTSGDKSHINSLDDIQDLTLDSSDGLLYWLTNNGRDLFEEFKENSTTQAAQHYLDGKSYTKLIYFDSPNQPTTQKLRFNVRKIIHMLSSSISSNRPTRSDGNEQSSEDDLAFSLRVRHSEMDSSRYARNAPYIILGVTCLMVITVYLVYALIFQRIQTRRPQDRTGQCGPESGGSISGDSSIGTESNVDDNSNGFVNSTTISRWVAGPSVRSTEALTFNRDINSFNGQLGAYDLESTNYDASNAIDEHYRDSISNNRANHQLFNPSSSRLANLSEWPTNMHDLPNKLYVPVEVLQDDALSSIRRVSIDQLEIERKAPLGEGHFGTVLQGTIKCSEDEKEHLLERSQMIIPCNGPISPDSLAPSSRSRIFAPSTSSSGHGSSSTTSCEFATANTCTDPATTMSNEDYLTPKNQLNSTSSDYGVEMLAGSSRGASYSAYCETNGAGSSCDKTTRVADIKLRVAIKKLKDNASPDEKRDFLQEAKLLANFDHPNIVHLIGICLDRGSTLIVMELMLGGDLIRYMKENTPNSMNNYSDNLTYDDLLKICLDIANGCCYLEDMDYIHRDLAARNCLVSSRKREERVVKLADFGLARDIYKDSYYKKLNDSAMPLKWMAPECLMEQKFTKKSDVWSFGVVMWEVMSYCQQKPYSQVEPAFMHAYLNNGARLEKPESCDDSMYRLMNQCWQKEPENRPTFHECRAMLIEIRSTGRL